MKDLITQLTHAQSMAVTVGDRLLFKDAATAIEKLEAENAQLRELMNCYNLGGWTNSLTLIKERDALKEDLLLEQAVCGGLKSELAAMRDQKPVLRVFLGTRGTEVTKDYGVMRFGEELDVYAAPGAK